MFKTYEEACAAYDEGWNKLRSMPMETYADRWNWANAVAELYESTILRFEPFPDMQKDNNAN